MTAPLKYADEQKRKEKKMNFEERVKMVKAMEFIARQLNDEELLYTWFSVGVPDGGIEYGDLTETDEDYCVGWFAEDAHFADLMQRFLDIMAYAKKSGGLYCDGVVSRIDK